MHENEPEFQRNIIMGDEAHFHFRRYVNKQNCHIWVSENPKMRFLGRTDHWALFFWKWSWSGCFGEWIALSNHD